MTIESHRAAIGCFLNRLRTWDKHNSRIKLGGNNKYAYQNINNIKYEPEDNLKTHVNSEKGKFLFVDCSNENIQLVKEEFSLDPLKLESEKIKERLYLEKHIVGLENTAIMKVHTDKQIYMVLTDENIPRGRPKTKIEINFLDPFKNFNDIERISKLEGMPEVIKEFGNALKICTVMIKKIHVKKKMIKK